MTHYSTPDLRLPHARRTLQLRTLQLASPAGLSRVTPELKGAPQGLRGPEIAGTPFFLAWTQKRPEVPMTPDRFRSTIGRKSPQSISCPQPLTQVKYGTGPAPTQAPFYSGSRWDHRPRPGPAPARSPGALSALWRHRHADALRWHRPPCLQGLVCPLWQVFALGESTGPVRTYGASAEGPPGSHAAAPSLSGTIGPTHGARRYGTTPGRYGGSEFEN